MRHDAKQSEPIRHAALDKLTKTLYNTLQIDVVRRCSLNDALGSVTLVKRWANGSADSLNIHGAAIAQ